MNILALASALRSALAVAAILALAVALIMALGGCASMGPYRSPNNVVQSPAGYQLGFVEFDDQGWFWTPGREQLLAVEQMIARTARLDTARPQPLILIAYVHGWKNNASDDPNINAAAFAQELGRLAASERLAASSENRTPRPVVGVYIGWPGLSIRWDPAKELSFWSRKNTGDRVGYYGGVTEVLTRLEALTSEINHPGRSKATVIATAANVGSHGSYFVVVGHSFGAQVVYNALLPVMTENLSGAKVEKLASDLRSRNLTISSITDANRAPQPLGPQERVRPFADLVVLVNPAFEGERYFNLKTLSERFDYASGQRPVLAIFLSKGDWATHYVFPIGRVFSTLFHRYRSDGYGQLQKEADKSTIPWTSSFITHTLAPDPDASSAPTPVNPDELWTTENRVKPMIVGGNKLAPTDPAKAWTPFYVVSVDDSIIKDHDDIWNDKFQGTLTAFVADTTRTKPAVSMKLSK
jgi:hypothetical protein